MNFLTLTKGIYKNIQLTPDLKVKGCSLKQEHREVCSCHCDSTLYLRFGPKSQNKETKDIQTGKEEEKLYLFKDYLIVYVENAMESTKSY